MTSAINSVTSQSTFSLPIKGCNQCGATDKKLSVCGQCHIEKYCSRACQAAAWPAHKQVCLLSSKKAAHSSKNISDIAAWSGKKFGELRGYRTIDQDVRILSHSGGFAIFLPKNLWGKLDYQVPLAFPENENSECWIAGKGFALVKFDVDSSVLDGSDKEYASENLDIALNKVEGFVRKNFFENRQAFPDSSYFTHGSFKDNPDMPRPFRFRLGGDFRYRF